MLIINAAVEGQAAARIVGLLIGSRGDITHGEIQAAFHAQDIAVVVVAAFLSSVVDGSKSGTLVGSARRVASVIRESLRACENS